MKKLISYFLIFALSLSTTPIQIFAQDLGEKRTMLFTDENGNNITLEYKPANSFKYDFYHPGSTDIEKFVAVLTEDVLTGFDECVDYVNQETQNQGGYNGYGRPAQLKEFYNDFLCYNIDHKNSPMWNYTALVAGDDVNEGDVLHILDYHLHLSQSISNKFENNAEYLRARSDKITIEALVSVLLVLLWGYTMKIAPEAVSFTIPYLNITVKVKKWVSFLIIMAGDIFISDSVAYHINTMNDEVSSIIQQAGFYKLATIKFASDTGLFRAEQEIPSERERIDQEIQRMIDSNPDEETKEDIKLIKRYFKKGYSKIDIKKRPKLKKALGKFLYKIFDGDEVLINDYVRKEMLRTYYALRFIDAELSNIEDPLRYKRAAIDLATTYKIQNIQVVDGRLFEHSGDRQRTYGQNLQYISGNYTVGQENQNLQNINSVVLQNLLKYIDKDVENRISFSLEQESNLATTYPTMLMRSEVNYLVQLMDMKKKEEDYQTQRARQAVYSGVAARNEELKRKSNYEINTGNPAIDNTLRKIHGGNYYNLTGTR